MNIFGGNIGGPIKKDKLFYFFNFERTTERTGYSGNYSVAPADFRAGNFSNWSQYSIVYDPATAPQNNAGARTPFPNNIVPQARWNSIFPNLYKDVPMPNQVSPTDPQNLSGNYGTSGVLSLNRNQYDTKINYNVNQKFVTWGKYSRMDAPVAGSVRLRRSRRTGARHGGLRRHHDANRDRRLHLHLLAHLPDGRRLRIHPHGPGCRDSERRHEHRSRCLEDPRHQRRQAVCQRSALRRSAAGPGIRLRLRGCRSNVGACLA